jgi:hypothetical protein
VLRELRGQHSATAAGVPKGPKAIIARIRASGSTVLAPDELTAIPLSGASWTQASGQANVIFGQFTLVDAGCERGSGRFDLLLDGKIAAESAAESRDGVGTYKFEFVPVSFSHGTPSTAEWIVDPSTSTPHTVSAEGEFRCEDSSTPATVTSLSVDVAGFR